MNDHFYQFPNGLWQEFTTVDAQLKGVNVKGYHVWSFMGDWSLFYTCENWCRLVAVDRSSIFKQSIKQLGFYSRELLS